MVASTNFDSKINLPDRSKSSFEKLLDWMLHYMWYVHSTSHIHMTLSPSQTYKLLEKTSKPSVNRLGLRKLYARGRRYFIRAKEGGGFQMTTTSRVWWHPKRRTDPTAILSADFEQIDEHNHRLITKSRVKLTHFLRQFFWPTFITSIIIFLEWHPAIIASFIFALYALSWASHRFTAMLESYEITYFIETVLDDFVPEAAPQLAAGDVDFVVDDFTSEWDRYVEEKHR